jgi:hypothetical protein
MIFLLRTVASTGRPGCMVLSARHEKEMLEVRMKQSFQRNFLFKESYGFLKD